MVESIQQFLKNKRIIFIGNSVEIMNHNLAEFIDKYDIVVRFGRAIEATPLQEKSLGTKCDIWVTGQFRAPAFNNVKEEFEETKEFQIKKWKEAKNQNKKTFSVVQHKLTGFFSDFPNPKGDK